ncbi:MAG: GLPGLI family protein [Bacteroides sp.]|nr:GLPGLI family protein [Bacteroides sp.]
MKCLVIALMLLLSADSLLAQNIESLYECIYKYTVSGQDKNKEQFTDVGYCMLQIGAGVGKFYDYSSYQTDSVKQAGCSDRIISSYKLREQKNVFFFDQTVYQNSPKGKITVQSVITPNSYNYEEGRYPVKWTVEEGEDTICGYTCRIAQGEYGGRTWIVRYAPEIPTQNGPWKFTGLPGLILDATDLEGTHHFSAITFRSSSVDITPLNNKGSITTSRERFIHAKNKFEENPMGNIPTESIGEMEIRKYGDNPSESTILINGIQLRMRIHPYIPLENE